MIRACFISLIVIVFSLSCKQHSDVDPLLTEALGIQDEAIHIGMSVDSVINARMSEGQFAQDIKRLESLKTMVSAWKANMIAVPGVEHDHKHHDHAGHDHHDHDHGPSADVTHLTPLEMKKVQEEWKIAIVAIRDSLN